MGYRSSCPPVQSSSCVLRSRERRERSCRTAGPAAAARQAAVAGRRESSGPSRAPKGWARRLQGRALKHARARPSGEDVRRRRSGRRSAETERGVTRRSRWRSSGRLCVSSRRPKISAKRTKELKKLKETEETEQRRGRTENLGPHACGELLPAHPSLTLAHQRRRGLHRGLGGWLLNVLCQRFRVRSKNNHGATRSQRRRSRRAAEQAASSAAPKPSA